MESYAHEVLQKDKKRKELIDDFLIKCENNMVNFSINGEENHKQNPLDIDAIMAKPLRIDHHAEVKKFIVYLTDFSLH